MKIFISILILLSILHFNFCNSKQELNEVKSLSFSIKLPISKCHVGKEFSEEEDVKYQILIIEEDVDNFTGLLKINSSNSSKWRYIHGHYFSQDSLVIKDSLAVLGSYINNIPNPKSTRLTEGTYAINIINDSLTGTLSIPNKNGFDNHFNIYVPPPSTSYNGHYIEDYILSDIEKDAWLLISKEKNLKSQFDSLYSFHNAFVFEYDKLPDSAYYPMAELAHKILESGTPFFIKNHNSLDSIAVQKDFYSRFNNYLRFSDRDTSDLEEIKRYLNVVQPEGSRFYLTWNSHITFIKSKFAWFQYKMQDNPEYSGPIKTKDEIRRKHYSKAQEFYLSINPNTVHPLEELDYYYMYNHNVVQRNPKYKDNLFQLLEASAKRKPQDENHLYHLNRIKDTAIKYETLNKQLDNPAYQFVASDINGKKIKLSDYENKVVYLEFWTTWCGPCRGSIPKLKKLYEKYHDSGFEIIGIAPDKFDNVVKFCKDENIPWPQIVPDENNGSNLTSKYGVCSFPKGYLIDKKGIIVEIIHPGDKRFDFILQQYLF